MNKKILIGSLVAIAILVLVSFTGVVGYQTTKSSTIAKASPLFTIRSSRAIDEESKDIACDYVWRGEESVLSIPKRDSETSRIQKAIDIISKMDDKAFSKFVTRIILNLKYQEQMTGKETSDALQALHNMRRNPNDMKYYDTKDIPLDETSEYLSCHWFPGCYIFTFYLYIMEIIGEIIRFIWGIFHLNTGWPMCIPPTTVVC